MEEMAERKVALRSLVRQQAKELPAEYLEASDAQIEEDLLALPAWKEAKTVFIYISMGTEPGTHGILAEAVRQGKRVGVPRCLGDGVMETREITSLEGLTPQSFGILEPDETAPLLQPEEFDLVVAPCVTADKRCYRLGNGGGYYDRYMTGVKCPVICLCRGRLLQSEVPVEPCDLPVSMVLTEEGLIRRLTLSDFAKSVSEVAPE